MKQYRKHLKILAVVFVLAVVDILLFNTLEDPYNIYTDVIKRRPADLVNKSYLTKAIHIIKKKPDTLLLGTSTVDGGFAVPGSMSSFNNDNYPTYAEHLQHLPAPYEHLINAGVNGGTMYEIYSLLKHAYKNNPHIKNVIIGLEWHIFTDEAPPNLHTPDVDVFNTRHVPIKLYLETAMTLHSTFDAYRTLELSISQKHKVLKNIRNILVETIPADLNKFNNQLVQRMSTASSVASVDMLHPKVINPKLYPETINLRFPSHLIKGKNQAQTSAFIFSIHYNSLGVSLGKRGGDALLNVNALEYLKRIVQFAREKNIKLNIYITPQHGTHWQTATAFGLTPHVDRWLREVAKITPYWDFSGAIDFSNNNADQYFSGDDRHFNYKAGELILRSIINGQSDVKHGIVYVTPKTIEQLLAYRHHAQAQWLNYHKYLADIYASKLFSKMKHLAGEDEKIVVMYRPTYHGHTIFNVMGRFVALPEQKQPYDLRQLLTDHHRGLLSDSSLEGIQNQISATPG